MTYPYLPTGGAMIITEYWPIGVFGQWVLPKMWSFGPDWILHVDVSVK